MKLYAQNREDLIVLNYFNRLGVVGTVLDIGANDGQTLSNSLLLIENGWCGVLFEPGQVYDDLHLLHRQNQKVHTHRLGIGMQEEMARFWQSGAHVKNGIDQGLVSTMFEHETIRWRKSGVKFKEIEVELVPFSWVAEKYPRFDFISIDAEGFDWNILQQIDLAAVGCSCLCIEWNSDHALYVLYYQYVGQFGFKEIHRNAENIIFVK